MSINTDPIFTNIGLNKMASAILIGSDIELTTLVVGDSLPDLNYQPTVLDTDIQNFIANTIVDSVHYLDLKESNSTIMRIQGKIQYQDALDYTIREYGVYDSDGDLIIIGRINDTEMKAPSDIRTELDIIVNVAINDTQKAFITNNVPSSDYVSIDDLTEHIDSINPHGLTKEKLGFHFVDNTSDLDKPINPYVSKLFYDTKLGVGVGNRDESTITKSGSVITFTPLVPTSVYKRGVRYIVDTPISINVSTRANGSLGEVYPNGYLGGFYVAYNPTTEALYTIDGNPDFDNDILITWFYRNRLDGIIWLADERHGAAKSSDMHRLHHLEVGATWIAGGLLLATTDDASNNKLTVTAPIQVADEDLNFIITDNAIPTLPFEQNLTDAKLPVLYIGTNSEYRIKNNNDADMNWLYDASGAVYNDVINGTLVSVPSGKYISYWLLFTTDMTNPVKLLIGRAVHNTLELAGAEELDSFGLPMPELIGAYKIVLYINSAHANLAKSKINSVFEISNSTRKSSIKANSHTLLLGRTEEGQHTVNAIKGLAEALAGAGKIRKATMTGTVKADVVEVDEAGVITMDTYMSDSKNMLFKSDPVFTDLVGSVYSSTGKWVGAALAPNGKIYCAPFDATQVLEIDPVTRTTTLIGSVYSSSYKWNDVTLAPNGKIYCTPYNATQVLEIDPVAKTTALIGSGYGVGGDKWVGAALAPNGKIYCIPFYTTQVLEIDPILKTTTLIGSVYSGDAKWYSATLAPNGKIYCVPYNATQVLEIDPIAKTTALIGSVYSSDHKWAGAALAPNGKIYCALLNATQVLEIDPVTKVTTLIGSVYSSTGKWIGAALAPNGKLYCAPSNATQVLEIDPVTKITTLIGSIYTGVNKWENSALAPNGKIYCAPRNGTQTLEIDTFPKTTDFQAYLKLPQ